MEVWWSMLQQSIDAIPVPAAVGPAESFQEPEQPESSTAEMLTELLHRVRQMDARLGRVEGQPVFKKSSRNGALRAAVELLREHQIPTSIADWRDDLMEISADVPLPSVLPNAVYDGIGKIAKEMETTIRLLGQDRTVTFDRSGYPDEPPF